MGEGRAGWSPAEEQHITLHTKCTRFEPAQSCRTGRFFMGFFCDRRTHLSAHSAHVQPGSVICYGSCRAFDSRAHPCTVTLGGEVEQGRVNDAARVGQSADLVTAPLFLLDFVSLSCSCYDFSQSEKFQYFVFLCLLWVPCHHHIYNT